MRFDEHDGRYILESGKKLEPGWPGALWVHPADPPRLMSAWDIEAENIETYLADPSIYPLTPEERREIAAFMIERWRRWAGPDGSLRERFVLIAYEESGHACNTREIDLSATDLDGAIAEAAAIAKEQRLRGGTVVQKIAEVGG